MRTWIRFVSVLSFLLATGATPAYARQLSGDVLCDPGNVNPFPGYTDCRDILIDYMDREMVGIDVAFWFMEDDRYRSALLRAKSRGVAIRVLVDPRANATYPLNAGILDRMRADGHPMRQYLTSYILHWKMMLFEGQGVVQFSGANYSADAWRPGSTVDYQSYTDEVIYFTDDPNIVNSFKTRFDDQWVDTVRWRDYANITGPLVRKYPTYPIDPTLNFPYQGGPSSQAYRTRALSAYSAERIKIDAIMFRITDRAHTDRLLQRVAAGIPVRLITEQQQYRDITRLWHSWNVDRLYMGGVQIKHRGHGGLNHQKSVLLYDQSTAAGNQPKAIFGSSNWTSPSSNGQLEHNIFTTKPAIVNWLVDQFERKWNNTGGTTETIPFQPLPPDAPKTPAPAGGATNISTTGVVLKWYGGPWAHLYDVYFGTSPNPTTVIATNVEEGPNKTRTSRMSYPLPSTITLTAGTTYYWKIVGKTMALQTRTSPVWSFTTAGVAPPPPPPPSGEIVVYASNGTPAGAWRVETDGTAAGGSKMRHPNAGGAKISTALANPTNYFEVTFDVEANRDYRLWMRGRADSNYWGNDSVFVQFSGSVNSGSSAIWRIGTTSATEYNLEDCSGCGLSNWGWQDNGWGAGVLGPLVRFATAGPQTMRIQTREDGLSFDQIVLSPSTYLNSSPGALENDTTILGQSGGEPDPEPEPEAETVVLYAGEDSVVAGAWRVEADAAAAGDAKIRHPNAGAAKIRTALASPVNYAELSFDADADRAYRIWLRGKADGNHWSNDSVFLQFDHAVDEGGSPIWRIGTTAAAEVNLEACSGCGISGWGWQDNGWGVNQLGPLVYFESTGQHTMRVQTREDGFAIDQIVLSPTAYLHSSPGSLKNDTTILAR